MFLNLNDKGYVSQRESQILEFKQSFRFGENLIEYARTMVGMANNRGGAIIFGIKDKPHEPTGLSDDRIHRFDTKELNQVFLDYFSTDVDWVIDTFNQFNKTFGIIKIREAEIKPIICSKSHTKKKLREGAIYFRYRGQTKEIRFNELNTILQIERDKEKQLWMKHIQSVATVGPRYAQIVNGFTGEMNVGNVKVIIDPELVSKLKVIKEGQFKEKEGTPTLRLVGDIEGLLSQDHVVYTETAYPHTQASILDKLPINSFEFQALIWKYSIKGNPRYSMQITTGKKSKTQKYSDKLLEFLRQKIREDKNIIVKVKKEFSSYRKSCKS